MGLQAVFFLVILDTLICLCLGPGHRWTKPKPIIVRNAIGLSLLILFILLNSIPIGGSVSANFCGNVIEEDDTQGPVIGNCSTLRIHYAYVAIAILSG